MKSPPEICPVCGADVPADAKACPECGADEETGWSDRARAQQLGLPDDEFDYDEFVREEFGERDGKIAPTGIKWKWWFVALFLLMLVLPFLYFFGCSNSAP
jgi:hypothetical protein